MINFYKRVRKKFSHPILCIIFQEKYFSCYVLLTDQISLSDAFTLWYMWQYVYCNPNLGGFLGVRFEVVGGGVKLFSPLPPPQFFWQCFVSLVKFSYWSIFYVNIITGFGVITISLYKGLTRNLEIGNTPVWVFTNIWRPGQVRNAKFGTNVSNKMLLNAAKYQGYSFYRFWVIKEKPTWGRG